MGFAAVNLHLFHLVFIYISPQSYTQIFCFIHKVKIVDEKSRHNSGFAAIVPAVDN